MKELNQKEWREQSAQDALAVILDVRTELEREEGYIANSVHMDIQNAGAFYEEAKGLDPEKNYYIYCRSGGRSGQACMLFNSLGLKNTFNLVGGIEAWEGDIVE